MIVTLEKRNGTYAQKQKNMHVVIRKVPFMTILTTAVITATLKIYSVSIMIHFIKHYLVSTQSKVTLTYDLLIKEAHLIKQKMPKLRASKDLKVFN